MLGEYNVIAFVATRQSDRARLFYNKTLGLRLVADTPFALVFDAGGTMLRISKVGELTLVPYTVLGWKVLNIRATVEGLTSGGVTFERYEGMPQDELGIWTTPNGDKVAWFKDPDGNTLSLSEFHSE